MPNADEIRYAVQHPRPRPRVRRVGQGEKDQVDRRGLRQRRPAHACTWVRAQVNTSWGSLALAPWLRCVVGVPLRAAGSALALWSMAVLGLTPTFGDEGDLVHQGSYRFPRNPQYVGFMAALAGWALVAGSAWMPVASLVGMVPFLLIPFAKEAWLAGRHGEAYEEYQHTVPRFIPPRKRRGEA
jgi:protein-S-isoprenylcysteine O-methyltransferase Ste14